MAGKAGRGIRTPQKTKTATPAKRIRTARPIRAAKSTKRRPPLDRERILRAAIALADRGGVEALSMRRLGRKLGVEAMSLYNHVANREEILSGIVDLIIGDIEVPESGGSWQESMRARAVSMRRVFTHHPWAVGLLESRKTLGPAALQYCDRVLGTLRRAGFSPVQAIRAFSLLDSYAYGYSIQEKSLSPGPAPAAAREAEEFLRELPVDKFPYLAETAAGVAASGLDYAREFEIGLDLLLGALDAWHGEESKPRH